MIRPNALTLIGLAMILPTYAYADCAPEVASSRVYQICPSEAAQWRPVDYYNLAIEGSTTGSSSPWTYVYCVKNAKAIPDFFVEWNAISLRAFTQCSGFVGELFTTAIPPSDEQATTVRVGSALNEVSGVLYRHPAGVDISRGVGDPLDRIWDFITSVVAALPVDPAEPALVPINATLISKASTMQDDPESSKTLYSIEYVDALASDREPLKFTFLPAIAERAPKLGGIFKMTAEKQSIQFVSTDEPENILSEIHFLDTSGEVAGSVLVSLALPAE